MTLEHGLRRTIPARGLILALRSHEARRLGHLAAWLAKWWELLLGV